MFDGKLHAFVLPNSYKFIFWWARNWPIYYDHFSVMKTPLETSVLLHQIYYSDSRLEPTIISFEESRIEKSLTKSYF